MRRRGMTIAAWLILAVLPLTAGTNTPDDLVKKISGFNPVEFMTFNMVTQDMGAVDDVLRVVKAAAPEVRETFLKGVNPGFAARLKTLMDKLPETGAEALPFSIGKVEAVLARMGSPLVRARVLSFTGKHAEALPLFEEAFKAGKAEESDYYNAACAGAMAGDKEYAFRYLEKCVQGGGDLDLDSLKADTDLTGLHADPRWEALLKTVGEKEAELVGKLPVRHEGTPVPLPEPKRDGGFSVEKALQQRRSVREYLDASLSLEDVSQLLWSAYGVTEKIENAPPYLRGGLKTAPSAGALYPLEIYLVAGKVTGLPAGVYLYKPESHSLLKVREGDVRDPLCQACLGQTMVRKAPVSLVYSAVYGRTTKKYGPRGRERYVCMDLGHSAENVYLQATALKMGTCAIGAFTDLKLRLVTNMTQEEAPLYVMPVGKTGD